MEVDWSNAGDISRDFGRLLNIDICTYWSDRLIGRKYGLPVGYLNDLIRAGKLKYRQNRKKSL